MSKSHVVAGIGFGVSLGVLAGFYVLAPTVEGGPTGNNVALEKQLSAKESEYEAAVRDGDAVDEVLDQVAGDAVAGLLKGKSIAVVTFPDANPNVVKRLNSVLKQSGAINAGTVSFTSKMGDSDSGDRLKSIAANSLPAGAQLNEDNLSPGMHAGQLVGAAITAEIPGEKKKPSESDRGVVFGALGKDKLIDGSPEVSDVDLAIVVTGNESDDAEHGNYGTQFEADFAAGLDTQLEGVVLGGEPKSADKSGAVGLVRESRDYAEDVSTVDNIHRTAGMIVAIQALKEQAAGSAGHYGSAKNAKEATVQLKTRR